MVTALLKALEGLTSAHWISLAAFGVSLVSLWIAVLNYRRDRHRLKITGRLFVWDGNPGNGPGSIEVKVINVGRRPIYLSMLWGKDASGVGSGVYFDYGGLGIKLGEHETKVLMVTHLPRAPDDYAAVAMGDDDVLEFERLWVEDSTGKRHPIPGSKRLLKKLGEDYGRWCRETGYWNVPPPSPIESPDVP